MPKTEYDAETDTLSCGCDPDWADHRCLGGSRPSYCCCGAPDDCYCPSRSERAQECDLTEKHLNIDLQVYVDDDTIRKITDLLVDHLGWTLGTINISEVHDEDDDDV